MKRYYPFVKPNYNTKGGLTPIYIRYDYDRKQRVLIPIKHSILYEHWDFKRKWVKKACPNYEVIDKELNALTAKLSNILTYAQENEIEPTKDYVIFELSKKKEYSSVKKKIDIFLQLEQYIKEKDEKVVPDVIKDYKALRKHLNGFKTYSSQPIAFKHLNSTFYDEFIKYLRHQAIQRNGTVGLMDNSIGKQIKTLKAFVRDRSNKKIIPPIDMTAFKVLHEDVNHITLTEEELAIIYEYDLSHNTKLEQIKDLLIFGCFTGLRYSDLSNLTEANINTHDAIILITQKKVHQSVTIPFLDYVPDILKKYNNNLPKVPLDEFNVGVKEIGRLCGITQMHQIVHKRGLELESKNYNKHQLIASHTCRRSFCTNMFLSGVPAEILMKISGHKTVAAFMRYIKIDNKQAANQLRELRELRELKKNKSKQTV
jgi:integrase